MTMVGFDIVRTRAVKMNEDRASQLETSKGGNALYVYLRIGTSIELTRLRRADAYLIHQLPDWEQCTQPESEYSIQPEGSKFQS